MAAAKKTPKSLTKASLMKMATRAGQKAAKGARIRVGGGG